MHSNSLAISIHDELDEPSRMRLRVRRKRKKSRARESLEWTHQIKRLFMRHWLLFILIPAAGLLLFEVLRIRHIPSSASSELIIDSGADKKLSPEKKPESSWNKLDPMTRIVGGVRQRCFNILPPEELQFLDIPTRKEPSSPIKSLMYISENTTSSEGIDTAVSQQSEVRRFNLFTGNQTFDQRNKSFQVNETVKVHCGFYSENGGFKISDDDKTYMDTCTVVVVTCAFGGGDDLYQPIGMMESSLKKVCYVAFWDEITVAAQEFEGHKIGEDGFIGKWRIVIVRNLPFSDQRLNGKIPKMLAHRLFPNGKYSIWVDSKSQFRRDPLGVLEALLWRSNSVLAISEHGARSTVYDEAEAVVKKNKATPEEVELQLTHYRSDGLPKDTRFNGKKGKFSLFLMDWTKRPDNIVPLVICAALAEASVIVREHTEVTNLFMCLWFNEVVRFTSRDQLSFPYVFWQLKKVLKDINMFSVCTRRDLVNSMGHLRKPKPLIKPL